MASDDLNYVLNRVSQSRSELMKWLLKVLEDSRAGGEFALINLWGCLGVGKSHFLKALQTLFETQPNTVVFTPWNAGQIVPDELARQIKQTVQDASETSIKVLLVDDLESLSPEDGSDLPAFLELETQLIAELIQRQDILFIITSTHELRQWHHFEIKMRQVSLPLPPIDKSAIQAVADQLHKPYSEVYAATYGYPLALAWLEDHPQASQLELDQYIAEELLGALSVNLQHVALISSLLLDFDMAVLQKAAQAAGIELAKNYYDHSLLVQQLAIAGFVAHDIRNGGYRYTNSAVRRLLARLYRSRSAHAFNAVHTAMADFYQQEAHRTNFLHQFLVNAIYHIAWGHVEQRMDTASRACQEWIIQMTPAWIGADWQLVLHTWESGRGNPDVVEEIIELIGLDTYQKIADHMNIQIEKADRLEN